MRSLPHVSVVSGAPPRAAVALRREVFVLEQGVDEHIEGDGRDGLAEHALMCDPDGRALATARLLGPVEQADSVAGSGNVPGPTVAIGVIGRVAVRRDARGRGLGRAVTRALEVRARERGMTAVEVHAQVAVEAFYATQGYVAVSDHYLEAGIEHVTMRKAIVTTGLTANTSGGP